MKITEIPYKEIRSESTKPKTVLLNHVKRHAIQINEMSSKAKEYNKANVVLTKELIHLPVDQFAFYAEEYYPDHTENATITYEAIINGKTIEMFPVNSHRGSLKVIKYDPEERIVDGYEEVIDEPIKKAQLRIIVKTDSKDYSPIVSNLKILKGEEVKEAE